MINVPNVHPTAIVAGAEIDGSAVVHEYCVIREGVRLGPGVVVHPFCLVERGVEIGEDTELFAGTIVGKRPSGAAALARKPEYQPLVTIGKRCRIGPRATIYYSVEIGDGTLVGDGASIREMCSIGSECIVSRYVTINYNTKVGDRTKIMDMTHVTGNCQIGNDVFISLLVGMTNDELKDPHVYDASTVRGSTIEDRAIVGAGATLLPGIRIGAGARVGAGSIVNKDVEPGKRVATPGARRVPAGG